MTLLSNARRMPAVKPVGEPDAGNPHVRFDERRQGDTRLTVMQQPAPVSCETL